jgi:hypothetical protein
MQRRHHAIPEGQRRYTARCKHTEHADSLSDPTAPPHAHARRRIAKVLIRFEARVVQVLHERFHDGTCQEGKQ